MTYKEFLAHLKAKLNIPYSVDEIDTIYHRALYAQAWHETGGFRSNIYKQCANMYGMKAPNSRRLYSSIKTFSEGDFACYDQPGTSILDRLQWDSQKSDFVKPVTYNDVDDYYHWVASKGYAEDSLYSVKLLNVYNQLFNNVNDSINANDSSFVTSKSKFIYWILLSLVFIFVYRFFRKRK